MNVAGIWPVRRLNLRQVSQFLCAIAVGMSIGWFLSYAHGVDHPISETPIPVDFCFWVSHPDLFRGQPVQTEAKYTQLIEGGAIDKDECQNLDISNYWSQTNDPVRTAWEEDLKNDFYTAQLNLTFAGTIPAYPRYTYWLHDAENRWRPMHRIITFRVDRLIHFKRLQ